DWISDVCSSDLIPCPIVTILYRQRVGPLGDPLPGGEVGPDDVVDHQTGGEGADVALLDVRLVAGQALGRALCAVRHTSLSGDLVLGLGGPVPAADHVDNEGGLLKHEQVPLFLGEIPELRADR